MAFKDFWKGFKNGSHIFGANISIIVNTMLLFIVYILGIGLTSIISKLMKKKFLSMKIDKKKDTYWSDLNLKTKEIEFYYRQF